MGGPAATVNSVTLGGSADHFALAVKNVSGTGNAAEIWADPNCAGGQTAVVINMSGSVTWGVVVYEVSGLAASSVVDQTSNNGGVATPYSSGSTATTTTPSQIWVGSCAASGGSVPADPAGYTDANGLPNTVAGYKIVASTGSAVYSAAISPTSAWGAAVATFKGLDTGGNDLPRIAPGPTWFTHFKPGMPRPHPPAPPPPLDFSTQPNLSDIPQVAPGPTWLGRFKQGMLHRRPRALLPPAPQTTGSLALRRPAVSVTASAANPVFPRNPLITKTEVLINGTWLDISALVYGRNNIAITRGLPDETQSATPASMTLTLNNRDGRFSPGNPLGAFYPYLTRNVQLRVSLTALSTTGILVANSYRFWGEVSSWPPRWDPTGTDIWCDITVSGPLRRYVQSAVLGSTLRQYYTSLTGNFVPYAYWPGEDGSGAGEIASALASVSAMTYTGAPGFASNASFGGSDPLPVISASAWHGLTGAASSPPGSGSISTSVQGLHHFTAPPGVTALTSVTTTGAGGGGGDASGTAGGGGGGGGGKGISASVPVTAGTTYAYYVGAGGAAGASTDGGDGEDSYLISNSGTLTGKGGKAGKLAGAGGAGGIGDTRNGGAGATGSASTSATFSQTLNGFSGSAGGGASGGHTSTSWTSPVTGNVSVTAVGGGGGGQGGGATGTGHGGGGGGGGAQSSGTITVTSGSSYGLQAGNGANGGSNGSLGGGGGTSAVSGDSGSVSATGGHGGSGGGFGGAGGLGDTAGGTGGNGHVAVTGSGMGGGGGGAGIGVNGSSAPGPNSNPRQPGGGGGSGSGGGWGATSNGAGGATTGGGSGSPGGGGGGGGAVTNNTGKVGGGGGYGYITWSWTESGVPAGGGGGSSAGSAGNGNAGSGSGTGGAAPAGGAAGGSAGGAPSGSTAGGGGAGGVPDSGDGVFTPGAGAPGGVAFSWTGGATSPVPADIIRFCLDIDSAGAANGAVLLRAVTFGTVAQLDLVYHTGGKLELIGYDSGAVQLFDSGQISFSADGQPLYVDLQLVASGANVIWSLSAIVPGASSVVTTATSSITGSVGYVSDILVDPAGTVTDNATSIGQITVQSYADTLVNLSPIVNGYAGETAAARISRLCASQGLAFALTGNAADTPQMGPQQDDTFVNLLQSCADMDRGQLFETRGAFGIGYRTRADMQGQNPVLSADYTSGILAGTLQPTADDQHTRNVVTFTRNNGASAVAQLTSGASSTATPPDGVGIYSYSQTVQAFSDTQLANLAAWVLTVGTVDGYRYPTIEFDLTRTEAAGLIDVIAGLDIGDFVQVASPPQFLQSDPISQLAFGFTEILNAFTWGIAINTVPESPYSEGAPPTW